MSALTINRTADVIAGEINAIKGQARQAILVSSVEIGCRLVEAKEVVPHGEWMAWLEHNVDYSQSTANNLMQIYREYGESQALGSLSYTKALALLSVPAEERDQFLTENDVEAMSARELQKTIKEKQQLEERLQQSERVALEIGARAQSLEVELKHLTGELEKAKLIGRPDDIQRLETELAEARTRVKELEAKHVDVPAVVERVPPELERELEDLRRKAAQSNGVEAARFRVCFEALTRAFQDVLTALDVVPDEDARSKFRGAVSGLISKMQERL